jgi:hypothetical protein
LHNATEIEKRGTPVVVVCTDPFKSTAEAMARRRGYPGYRYILVEHPLSSARPEGVRERAEKALPEMLSIILGEYAPQK